MIFDNERKCSLCGELTNYGFYYAYIREPIMICIKCIKFIKKINRNELPKEEKKIQGVGK